MMVSKLLASAGLAMALLASAPASADDCLIGELKVFAGTFAPRGYLLAQGQTVQINQYQALFAVLGTTYGGDGVSVFKVPDLRGRLPIGAGQGPGLGGVQLGQASGGEWTYPQPGQAAAGSGADVGMPVQIINMQPSTAVNYILCVDGIYPSRS